VSIGRGTTRGHKRLTEEGRGVLRIDVPDGWMSSDHARLRREAAERGKRAARRAQTAALDRGLALVGLWLRDIACILDGVPELAHNSDRAALLAQDAQLGVTAAQLRAAQGLVEETRASFEYFPNDELALDALGSRLARTLAG
jgi:hypothetical protein